MPGRALVFDFDGLIVDTEWPEYVCWRKAFESEGLALTPEDWVHVIGSPDVCDFSKVLEQRLGRRPDWESLTPRRLAWHKEEMGKQAVLPGVRELMEQGRAAGWGVGVASNSTAAWVEGNLERYGLLPLVQTVRSRDRVTRQKPFPDPFLLACQDLGADPAASWAFEDSFSGVTAARAAGLTVVAVPNRLTLLHDLGQAHHRLGSLAGFRLPQ